jgi:hypothetical protein
MLTLYWPQVYCFMQIYFKAVPVLQITACLYLTSMISPKSPKVSRQPGTRTRLARNLWRLQLYSVVLYFVNIITERHALYLYREQPCRTCTGSSLAVPVLGAALMYLYREQPCCTCTGRSIAVLVLGAALLNLYWAQPCCTCTGRSLAVPVLGAALLYLYWAQPCCTCTGRSNAVPVLGVASLYLY